jgi:hypothetical protein
MVPTPLWQHNIPRIYEREKDGFPENQKEKVIFGWSWNCWEEEIVLKKQRFLDKNTGKRVEMPRICPDCRLIENIRTKYDDTKELGFCEKLFHWCGDDASKAQTLTVGGILSRYGRDDLTSEEKELMSKNGINPREAWREGAWAKCNYIFVVVEEGQADDGVQIAVETTQVGQVVQEMIAAQRESLGLDEGDPLQNPYAIRWKYNANADLSKKYNAIAMPKIVLAEEVRKLIHSDPPDIAGVRKPGDVAALRTNLETAALEGAKKLDWDWIFGPAEKAAQAASDQTPAENLTQAVQSAAEPRPTTQAPDVSTPVTTHVDADTKKSNGEPAKKRRRKKKEAAPPPPPPSPDTEPCEECGEQMASDATKCGNCGAEYDFQDSAAESTQGDPVRTDAAEAKADFEF